MSKKGACCFHLAKGKIKPGAQNHNERNMSYDQKMKLDTKVAELHDCINQLANSGAKKTEIDKMKLSPELKLMVYDAMGIKSPKTDSTEDNSQRSVLSIDKKSEGAVKDSDVDVSKMENEIKKVQSQINELMKDNGRRIGHVFPEKSDRNEIWNISMDPDYNDTKFPKKGADGKAETDKDGNIILEKSNVQAYIEEVQTSPNAKFNVNTYQEKLLEDYKQAHGFAMRSNGVPLREGIIVGNELTTMDMIKDFCKDLKETYGMQAIHIAIHHDEGHIDRDTEVFKENFHAHVIFDCVKHDNHYSMCRLERKDTANTQTMLSKCLDMERGEVRSAATHFDGIVHALKEYEKSERKAAFVATIIARVNPNMVMLNAIKEQAPLAASKAADDNKVANALRIAAKELGIKPAIIAANVVKDEIKRLTEDKSDESVQLINKLYKKVLTKEDKLNGVPKDAPFEQKVDFIIKKVDEAADMSDKVTREQDIKIFRPIEYANDILNIDVFKPISDAIIEKVENLSADEIKATENAQNAVISLDNAKGVYDRNLHNILWNTLNGLGGDASAVQIDAVNKGLENIQNEVKSATGILEETNKELASSTKELEENKVQSAIAIQQMDNAIAKKYEVENDIISLNEAKSNVIDEIEKKQSELSDVKVEIAAATYEINELSSILADTADSANAIKKDLIDIATFGGLNVEDNADTETIIKSAQSAVLSTEADLKKNIESSLSIVGSSKADMLKDEIHSAIEVINNSPENIKHEDIFLLASMADKIGVKPSDTIANVIINKFEGYPEKNKSIICGNFDLSADISKADASTALKNISAVLDENKTFSQDNAFLSIYKPPYGFKFLSEAVLNKVDELAESAKQDPKAEEQLTTVAKFFHIDLLTATKNAVERGEDSIKKKMDKAVETQTAQIKSKSEVLMAQTAQINKNQTTIDEQDVRISQKQEKETNLVSSIAGLEKKEKALSESLDDKAKPSSVFGSVMKKINDVVDKSIDALDNVLPDVVKDLSKGELKQLNIDLLADNARLQHKIDTMTDKMDSVKIEARRDGITEGLKKAGDNSAINMYYQTENKELKESLNKSKTKVEDLTKQVEKKDASIESVKSENSTLRKIIDAMMPAQPKAIQLLNKMEGFSLKNIFDAIKDNVIKCFTGTIKHPEYKNDPIQVFEKDIVIRADKDEPLIDNKEIKELAQEQHVRNEQKQSQGHGL